MILLLQIQKSYWFGVQVPPSPYKLLYENDAAADQVVPITESDQEFFEPDPQDLVRTVEIKGLRKVLSRALSSVAFTLF